VKSSLYLLFGFALSACTKQAALKTPQAKKEEQIQLSAKVEKEKDPGLTAVESLFEAYKKSHMDKSLLNLGAVYPGDFSVAATWKGSPQTPVQWRANRKKFLNPIKSVEFGEAVFFKKSSKNVYAVAFKEIVETYDKRKTTHYGYLESAPEDDKHFAVETISLVAADFDRWRKEAN